MQLKNKNNYGSYVISLENSKETELQNKSAFELYKCCKYMTFSILNNKLKNK